MTVKDILSEIEKKMEENSICMIQMHKMNPILVSGFRVYDDMVVLFDYSDMNHSSIIHYKDIVSVQQAVGKDNIALFIKEFRKLPVNLEVCLDSQYGQKAVCLCEADDSLIILGEDELH